jgi:energy-converting hydrogenase Eha subunit C
MGAEMKEVEVIIGIIFIVLGAILFSMHWGNITKLFGFVLMSAGVIIYVVAVDSIDEKKRKKRRLLCLRLYS